MAGVGDVASVLEIRVLDVDRAAEKAQAILAAAGDGFATTTWQDENRALFRALRLEKLVTAIFIGLITFVAGLNILVVLAMTVTDRAKDIAVLMSLGAYRAQVRNVFMLQGLAVGLIGTISGLVIGLCNLLGGWNLPPDSSRSSGVFSSVRNHFKRMHSTGSGLQLPL